MYDGNSITETCVKIVTESVLSVGIFISFIIPIFMVYKLLNLNKEYSFNFRTLGDMSSS
jgi:hypothetical protein